MSLSNREQGHNKALLNKNGHKNKRDVEWVIIKRVHDINRPRAKVTLNLMSNKLLLPLACFVAQANTRQGESSSLSKVSWHFYKVITLTENIDGKDLECDSTQTQKMIIITQSTPYIFV